jgi:hypothetical protein
MAHFRIEILPDMDASKVSASAPGLPFRCILAHIERPTSKLIKIDSVKGGRTKWDGAIAYATITSRRTELFLQYLRARSLSLDETVKARYLFRYDLFNQSWSMVATDIAPLNSPNFNSSNVPTTLTQD